MLIFEMFVLKITIEGENFYELNYSKNSDYTQI